MIIKNGLNFLPGYLFSIITVLFFLFACSYQNNKNQSVRIKITTYSNLPHFSIKLRSDSRIEIDGIDIKTDKIRIKPAGGFVSIGDNNTSVGFKRIEITANKGIFLISPLGEQEFTGKFEIETDSASISMINVVDKKDYFAAVLGAEMGENFSDEALKSQAIAIRTYYEAKKIMNKMEKFDCKNADGSDMVYRGISRATIRMYRAFDETWNKMLFNPEGKLALPLFHSTSGGIILKDKVLSSGFDDNITDPVLLADVDMSGKPRCRLSPYFSFHTTIEYKKLIDIIRPDLGITRITGIKLKNFYKTPCVDFIGFESADEIRWMKAFKFISLCQQNGITSIRSVQFNAEWKEDSIEFHGNGFGHLCGMSQYGAESMARDGYNYKKILKTYYPCYSLVNMGSDFR
jgi:stage II sporulation protein D